MLKATEQAIGPDAMSVRLLRRAVMKKKLKAQDKCAERKGAIHGQ